MTSQAAASGLIPDGNVYPEMPSVPSETWLVWLDGMNKPVVDEGDSLDPDENVVNLLLDAQVLSVQRNSAGDRLWEFRDAVSELVHSPRAGCLVSSIRTFLWCCKFMSDHALHPLAHHSRTQWATPYSPCAARK